MLQVSPGSILDFFGSDQQSVIPLFQRPYSWKRPQWNTLFRDLKAKYDQTTGPVVPHFLGAVVSMPWQGGPIGIKRYLVIDGQQRLTTVAVILSVLRRLADDKEAERFSDYLTNRHEHGETRYKLLPTQRDREAFRAVCEQTDGSVQADGHRLQQACSFFHSKLEGLDPSRFLQVLRNHTTVVSITLADSDDPYLIFESLNHKGSPLTQADLIRNYILMHFAAEGVSQQEQEDIYYNLWQPIERRIDEVTVRAQAAGVRLPNAVRQPDRALAEFLRADAMRVGGQIVGRRHLYEEVRERLRQYKGAEPLRNELDRLKSLSLGFCSYLGGADAGVVGAAARVFAGLVQLNQTTPIPLVLTLLDLHAKQVVTDQVLSRAVDHIETFIIRRLVCEVPTNQLQRLFVRWGHLLHESPRADADAWLASEMVSETGNRRCPQDAEFTRCLTTLPTYGKPQTRLMLQRLEQDFGHKEPADLATATIEHLMPQTLNAVWKNDMGPQGVKEHPTQLHRWGNLALTGYNSELGNKPWPEKAALLKESHYELAKQVADTIDWGPEQIQERSARLAERFRSLWPFPA